MAAFIIILFIIWVTMWGFFRFMYPKPPKEFIPKEGDIITARDCDYCGYPLAEYRGVLEDKPESALTSNEKDEVAKLKQLIDTAVANGRTNTGLDSVSNSNSITHKSNKSMAMEKKEQQDKILTNQKTLKKIQTWFFCNYDHQADFHKKRDL